MTCIVGIARGGRVLLGGDSAAVGAADVSEPISTPKVFKAGDVLMGVAGSLVVRDICQYSLELPPVTDNPSRWMRREFVPALRKALDDAGVDITERDSDDDEIHDFDVLVGVRGRLYAVQADMAVSEPEAHRKRLRFFSAGAGSTWAIGAVYALRNTDLTLQQLATEALEASAKYCGAVRPPWRFVEGS